jgi:17beta-estradiol 17-dehydrogenase / very-long-chain 3-oxoacyl-CoA reductase
VCFLWSCVLPLHSSCPIWISTFIVLTCSARNILGAMQLCKAVLPGMKSRRRGAIVNLGSANGLLPAVPLLSTYAGSKSFINQFTRSLDAELRQFNIRVQDQCPMFVATKMSKIRRARLDAPSPKVWAKAAVRQIGYDTVRTPYWYHGLMMAVVQSMLPAWAVTGYVLNLHRGFRTKYYRKQARQSVDGPPADAAAKKVI